MVQTHESIIKEILQGGSKTLIHEILQNLNDLKQSLINELIELQKSLQLLKEIEKIPEDRDLTEENIPYIEKRIIETQYELENTEEVILKWQRYPL